VEPSDEKGSKLIRSVGFALALVLVAVVAGATVPYVFQAGAPIRASEVNANFQYADSLAASSGNGQLVRVTYTYPANSGQETIFTVPADAAAPYILRSASFGGCGNYLSLSATGTPQLGVHLPSSDVLIASGLSIPFAPGESITAFCGTPLPVEIWLVFSK
jgi:hypothetical protein